MPAPVKSENQSRPAKSTDLRIDPCAANAVDKVEYLWSLYEQARTPDVREDALSRMPLAMAELRTWIPGYNDLTGEVERPDGWRC